MGGGLVSSLPFSRTSQSLASRVGVVLGLEHSLLIFRLLQGWLLVFWLLGMFQPLEGRLPLPFSIPAFGCIFILMEINSQETSVLGGTHPKARHLSRISRGLGRLCLCHSQLGQGRLAFSSNLWGLQRAREGREHCRLKSVSGAKAAWGQRRKSGLLVMLEATGTWPLAGNGRQRAPWLEQ